jgi:hypothetical protein
MGQTLTDLDAETYAVIRLNQEAARRIEERQAFLNPPKELVISLEAVAKNHHKIEAICAKFRAREATLSRGVSVEPSAQLSTP